MLPTNAGEGCLYAAVSQRSLASVKFPSIESLGTRSKDIQQILVLGHWPMKGQSTTFQDDARGASGPWM
jgi:hypothetical protein